MSRGSSRTALPAEIEAVVRAVLEAARLELVDGREEVERELRAHFEDGLAGGASAAELIERFGDPVEAGRRIARTRPRAAARNRGETGRWWMSVHEWLSELRKAARRLRRAPGFSLIVILTLGLGVGANTAIFTVLDAVMLEDLPYPEPDRLVRVYESRVENPTTTGFLRVPVFREYREWDDVFESLAAIYTYREVGADLTDGDVPRRVTVLRVSAGYFETLGIAPERGRTFHEDESFGPGESLGSTDIISRVALISHGLWTSHFGADPGLVGGNIQLDGASFEVIGVMPAGFQNPFGPQGDVWIPQDVRLGGSNNLGNSYLSAVGRLQPGITVDAARERVKTLSAAFGDLEPRAANQYALLFPLQDDVVGETRAVMLWILAAAAALVLLTACLNVANLLFARGLAQDRHLALRSALGSGRARLVSGILTENGLLALFGGLAGLGIGWAGVRGLTWVAPDALPGIAQVRMSGDVFLFALVVTVVALLAFGLTPAVRLTRTAPSEVLRSGDRAATTGRAAKRLRDGLVVAQVAAALVLVAGATLLTRSFDALTDVPLGVDERGVLTFEVHLPGGRYPDGPTRHAFHEAFQERIRGLPTVEAVGATSWLPVMGRYHSWGFQYNASTGSSAEDAPWSPTDVRIIAGDYFDAMGIDLLRGTPPTDIDYEAEPVVWINEDIAEDSFGERDPIGEQIRMNGAQRRVVGIVEDVPHGARGEVSKKLYLPHAQFNDDRNWALIQTVRARGDLGELQERVRAELATLDGQLVLHRPRTFAGVLDGVRAQDRFATVLMGSFALLALLLALLGTYGVLAGSVAGRRREIGIRMALGADEGSVRAMVLRYGATITLTGVGLGLVGAWVGSRWIESLLFGVEPSDPLSYIGTVSVFVACGLFAAWLPALRATRVDTVQTLTAE